MKNNWYIGTFYTKNTLYEDICKHYLHKSCKQLDLEKKLYTVEIENEGNWYKNVAQKPRVILDLLTNVIPENDCLVFLDADATIEKYPELFDNIPESIDMSFHVLSWKDWYGYNSDTTELLSGTIFIRNNQHTRNLCRQWYELANSSNDWEQKILERILFIDNKIPVTYQLLPVEYCYIISRPGNLPPLVVKDPIILHHQISRVTKKQGLSCT